MAITTPKVFTRRYLIALSVIGLLAALSQYLIQASISHNKGDAKLINVAGRQRMFSQKMTKELYQAILMRDTFTSKEKRAETVHGVERILAEFAKSHLEVIVYSGQYKQNKELGQLITQLDEEYETLTAIVFSMLDKIGSSSANSRADLDGYQALAGAESSFLITMDKVVGELEAEANAKIESLVDLEFVLFAMVILVLVLEARLVFRPAVRQLQQSYDALNRAVDQAQQATRTKGRFLAVMSHEIRTPMHAIMSCSDLLTDKVVDRESKDLVRIIRNSCNGLLAIINDVLDFSKLESDKMRIVNEPFDLKGVFKDIIDLLSSNASMHGIRLEVRIEDDVPLAVVGDSVRLEQVLTNLLGNAVKFTSTKVEVTVKSKSSSEGNVVVSFQVKDDGPGISSEDRDLLFKEFSQLDNTTTRARGGTGLGLAIAKTIVDAMKGKIGVISTVGEGSMFYAEIPFQVADMASRQTGGSNSLTEQHLGKTHPLKILVAEDNSVNQMVIKRILAKLGYDADIVENGEEAVELALSKSYDLILMDQHMPVMDGIEATKRIRASMKNGPVIVALTASVQTEDRERCLQAGMDAFLTKPIVIRELVSILKSSASKENEQVM